MEIKEIIEKIPDIKVLSGPFQGGQKEVYKCEINGKENALKFIKSTVAGDEGEIRCEREINTLSMCNSKHLIKLGEIPYTVIGAEWLVVVKRVSEKKTERRSHSIQAE